MELMYGLLNLDDSELSLKGGSHEEFDGFLEIQLETQSQENL